MNYKIIQGNNLDTIKELEDNSIDSIVTDPPYGLSFMGKKWDYDVPGIEIWQECLRVLKPGGFLLAFAGTRTQHRMCVNIEDAGFEIRDMIAWVYGSGFPKSHNIGKAVDKIQGNKREVVGNEQKAKPTFHSQNVGGKIKEIDDIKITKGTSPYEGWGTALKPALEPITVARKPLSEKTVANNVLKYGTGGINIDGCRVGYQGDADKASATPQGKCTANLTVGSAPDVDMSEVDYNGEKYWYKNEYKNLIKKWLDDEDYVWSELKENLKIYEWCKNPEIESGDRVLFDSQEGICIRLYESKRKEFERPKQTGRFPANFIQDGSDEVVDLLEDKSRFFYTAKCSKKDRNEGLDEFEEKFNSASEFRPNHMEKTLNGEDGSAFGRFKPTKNNHPTVKPTALMQYLVRLVTPKGGTCLDPFTGSGSTGKACVYENFNFIGLELDEEYCKITEARIEFAIKDNKKDSQTDMFDFIGGE